MTLEFRRVLAILIAVQGASVMVGHAKVADLEGLIKELHLSSADRASLLCCAFDATCHVRVLPITEPEGVQGMTSGPLQPQCEARGISVALTSDCRGACMGYRETEL